MGRDSTIQVRIDSDLKEKAMNIVEALRDRSLSDVVNEAIKDFVDENQHVIRNNKAIQSTESEFDLFDLKKHANTIAFVVGPPGCGKTTWANGFLEYQNTLGYRTVVFDFLGEYSKFNNLTRSHQIVEVSSTEQETSLPEGNIILNFKDVRSYTGSEPAMIKCLSWLMNNVSPEKTVFLVDELNCLNSLYESSLGDTAATFLSWAVKNGGGIVAMTQQPEQIMEKLSLSTFLDLASVKIFLAGPGRYFEYRNPLSDEAMEFLKHRRRGNGIMVNTCFKPVESNLLLLEISKETEGTASNTSPVCLERISTESRFSFTDLDKSRMMREYLRNADDVLLLPNAKTVGELANYRGFSSGDDYFDHVAALLSSNRFFELNESIGDIRSVGGMDHFILRMKETGRSDVVEWVATH